MALTDRFRARLAGVRDSAGRRVGIAWATLADYDDESAFVERVVPIVTTAQTQAAALTDAFVTRRVGELTGESLAPAGVDPDVIAGARSGVTPEEVYRRPFTTLRVALAADAPWEMAIARAGARAVQAAVTDVALASRAAAGEAMRRQPSVVGYRRVLSGSSCRLCLMAATQRYHVGQLMPMHPNCDCTVEPITGTRDPGHVLAPCALGRIKQAERAGVRLSVVQHGELGPVLWQRGHDFERFGELVSL